MRQADRARNVDSVCIWPAVMQRGNHLAKLVLISLTATDLSIPEMPHIRVLEAGVYHPRPPAFEVSRLKEMFEERGRQLNH